MKDFYFIGVSLSNPTFTQQDFRTNLILSLDEKWIKNYKINLFDAPLVNTLEGIWYTKEKAIKESQKKARYTKNKISAWFANNNHVIDTSIYLDRNDIYNNTLFKETYNLIKSLYDTNPEIKTVLQEESKKVIDWLGKNYNKDNIVFNVDKASFYIIEELAFFFSSANIYDAQSSNLIYYKSRDLLEKIKPFIPDNMFSNFSLITI